MNILESTVAWFSDTHFVATACYGPQNIPYNVREVVCAQLKVMDTLCTQDIFAEQCLAIPAIHRIHETQHEHEHNRARRPALFQGLVNTNESYTVRLNDTAAIHTMTALRNILLPHQKENEHKKDLKRLVTNIRCTNANDRRMIVYVCMWTSLDEDAMIIPYLQRISSSSSSTNSGL